MELLESIGVRPRQASYRAMPLSFWSSTELMNRRNRHLFAVEKLLLLLILTPYLRLQNRRFGRAQIFKSQIPFIYCGFPDDSRRQVTTDFAGWSPTLSATIPYAE